ncbi:hypothetical protein [Flavobacterium selenitireducens]|uniref:hypothetical protein n=1 Tax=Flavobacterium selenitireducens TaxID=2722704 RepID=UPI00168AF9A5|nr:hypothetical protein [Flavobacterium selenitireducens]MBD3581391.1 hypothetical protein [Flavobacterium selenitireducens]
MKAFFLKLGVFVIAVVALMTLFMSQFGQYVDYFYGKFTTPAQHSLITGDSKSLSGLRPALFDEQLKGQFELPMFNYSFTMSQAVYGSCYLESIRRKLDPDTKNGLFILSVSPWMLSERPGDEVENGVFFESDMAPHNMRFPNMKPNPEYFLRNFNNFHFKAVFRQASRLHEDGWYEEHNVPNDERERAALHHHHEGLFRQQSKIWKPSGFRMQQLKKTVSFLKKHGTVVLLRMPSSANVNRIEDAYWQNFDSELQQVAKSGASYLNYAKSYQFPTFDGSHLDYDTATAFGKALCDTIRNFPSVKNKLPQS